MGDKLKDLTGMTFGLLKVIRRAPNRGKRVMWECECQCENKTIKIVAGTELKTGRTKSCGCYKRKVDLEKIAKYNSENNAESHTNTDKRLYEIWTGMKKDAIMKIVTDLKTMVEEELKYVMHGKIASIHLVHGH